MRAIITTKYGSADHLQLQDIDTPIAGANEILINVHASTVTAGDVMLRRLTLPLWLPLRLFMGIRRKRTPGHEFSGVVYATGEGVTRFNVGDAVFGTTTGLRVGSNADYLAVPEEGRTSTLAYKPEGVTHEQAAVVPVGGMTALYLLKKADIQAGDRLLVYGASGSVGSYAVQLAKHFGAHVTGVCSTRNIELVTSLGADHVIDYTIEDFTSIGNSYDVILDAVGKITSSQSERVLSERGSFVTVQSTTHESRENLRFLAELLQQGVITPVIDRCYALEDVAEAHRYVETGRKTGNVTIRIAE